MRKMFKNKETVEEICLHDVLFFGANSIFTQFLRSFLMFLIKSEVGSGMILLYSALQITGNTLLTMIE